MTNQPNSEKQIAMIIDGEHVSGVVHYTGSTDINVRLLYPAQGLTAGLHMPSFARGVHPEGFLGDYGEQRARNLLERLYRLQKTGTARRSVFAASKGTFQLFGVVRYLRIDPGQPERSRVILDRESLELQHRRPTRR